MDSTCPLARFLLQPPSRSLLPLQVPPTSETTAQACTVTPPQCSSQSDSRTLPHGPETSPAVTPAGVWCGVAPGPDPWLMEVPAGGGF